MTSRQREMLNAGLALLRRGLELLEGLMVDEPRSPVRVVPPPPKPEFVPTELDRARARAALSKHRRNG